MSISYMDYQRTNFVGLEMRQGAGSQPSACYRQIRKVVASCYQPILLHGQEVL